MNKDKIIRVLSVTPVVTIGMLLTLIVLRPEIFPNMLYLVLTIIFLSVMTLIAYPLQKVLPGWKEKGRDGQRMFALYLGTLGYLLGFIVNLIIPSTKGLDVIYGIYALSVVILFVFNKLIKIKASGHIGGLTCIMLVFVYFGLYIPACIVVLIMVPVIVSSLRMKRHTPKEFLCGALCAFVAMGVIIMAEDLWILL